MKIVLQRVNSASVEVENSVIGEISKGILIFVGISKDFEVSKLDWMVNKVLSLRLWGDSDKPNFKMNIKDISGDILVVSQFTLFGDCSNGTKPCFNNSLEASKAKEIYTKFVDKLRENSKLNIQTGEFGAHMNVKLENDGPITLILEK